MKVRKHLLALHESFALGVFWAAASCLQGIYRVNGVKTRVEKLCQAFENGKELVELSQCSPHDISNVLKLYLRQVHLASWTRAMHPHEAPSEDPVKKWIQLE